MGQTQSVQVFVLVTEGTIEENLLATLAAKKDLALAALDSESEVEKVDLASGIEELKGRLEVLLGARPEAPPDQSMRPAREPDASASGSQRDRVAAAGGELLGAAFKLLGELVSPESSPQPADSLVATVRSGLEACVEEDGAGKPRLTFTMPDRGSLEQLAQTLARLLVAGQPASVPQQAPARS
jgi:hypothetical protein